MCKGLFLVPRYPRTWSESSLEFRGRQRQLESYALSCSSSRVIGLFEASSTTKKWWSHANHWDIWQALASEECDIHGPGVIAPGDNRTLFPMCSDDLHVRRIRQGSGEVLRC